MAGKLKEVRDRMKSVQSTQQITKAMKMVSAAKLRKSQEAIQRLRPYANQLRSLLIDVASASSKNVDIPLLTIPKKKGTVLVICITSDRGLCGAYNTNLVKLTEQHILTHYQKDKTMIWGIGKKGAETLTKKGYQVDTSFQQIGISVQESHRCAEKAISFFLEEKVTAIDLIFSEFKNAAVQVPTVEAFLPFQNPKTNNDTSKKTTHDSLFIFEQNASELLSYIIPLCLKTQLYKAILDNQASEHGARMTSMDKATENANEIFKQLKISYNRARQAAITTELSEIIAGAAAL